MALELEVKTQLADYLKLMEGAVSITVSVGDDEDSKEMLEYLEEIVAMSDYLSLVHAKLDRTPSFKIGNNITFAGMPLGHEFTSLILALLQVSGRKPKADESVMERTKQVEGKFHFETYVSLTCHNCPDVVQSLNMMSVLNKNITHTMIDGSVYKSEVEEKSILAVPAVFLNGEFFGSGRMGADEILEKMGSHQDASELDGETYDVLVVGGGPAGAAAAIYAARKGIKTGILAERFGGQVMDTMSIENLIGTPYTEGPKLAFNLEEHVKEYEIDIHKLHRAKHIESKDMVEVELENGATINSKTVIIATGAKWRKLGVPGEAEFANKGVAYCPHCDGPLFKGRDVAVVGGGNSGVEAAIDLAGIVNHVTLLEYGEELKADQVLQDKLRSLPNVTILTNAMSKEIVGTDKVSGIIYTNRNTNDVHTVKVEGIFVQIGLVPNTEWLDGIVEMNPRGEILVDIHGATNVKNVFAAGDCTTSPHKQIIISMGAGANAALSAFDAIIRG